MLGGLHTEGVNMNIEVYLIRNQVGDGYTYDSSQCNVSKDQIAAEA